MKKFKLGLIVGVLCLIGGLAQAAKNSTLTLVNHYGKDLTVRVPQGQVNVPNFAKTEYFTIANQASRKSKVLASPLDCQPQAISTFVQVFIGDVKGQDGDVFFGINRGCAARGEDPSQVAVSGLYVAKNIAYSWLAPSKHNKIIFCTPQDFEKHGKCV